LSECW